MTPQALVDAGLDTQGLLKLLYGDVDGYGLSNAGRERMGVTGEDFVYGEVTPEVIWDLLKTVNVQPGETFYDLGSGTGKGVLFASLLSDLGKSVGIELLRELHDSANIAFTRYRERILPHLPEKHWQEIEYRCADMLEQDIADADIVFAHCTCWSPRLMDGITEKFARLRPGARVITVSKELQSPHYRSQGSMICQMAWGTATAYFWERM